MRLGGDPEAARLAACLVASLAVHAGAVAWLPELHPHEQESMASVLSV